MEPRNNVTCFVLLGLTQDLKEQKSFLLCSCSSTFWQWWDLLIIVTITFSKTLNSPMYFFLACISFMDVTYSSCIIPILRSDFFFGENSISFEYCMIQLFIQHISGGSEVFLLLAMAYDRYVAICMLLHYLVIMRQRMYTVLLVLSCTGGFVHSVIHFTIALFTDSHSVALKGCGWMIRRWDSWPLEETNSIRGQRRGWIAQSFCVIKFY